MVLLIEAVVIGILVGGVYALMASGLTLIFGVMDIINLAQGIFVILGAYLSYTLERHFHIDIFLSLFLTAPLMFALGMLIQWVFLRRVKQQLSILVTYGLALIIEGALNYFFTPNIVELHAGYIDATIRVAGYYLPVVQLITFGLSVVLLTGLSLLVYRTGFGRSMRATMQNRTAAQLIGIEVERVSAITFGIGMALAAVGGTAFGATNVFNAATSYDLISRLLVIIVLGGLGSLTGTLCASLIMIVVGEVTSVLWSPVWSSTVFFALLVLLLVFRPQGLLGKMESRKQ